MIYNKHKGEQIFLGNRSTVITKEEIINALAKDKPELQKRFKVRRLALFGSFARDEQRADSDVDILVEVDPSIGLEFVTLAERIEKLLGLGVDLVSSRAVTAEAMEFIESELIYV
jgi:predicted nucleotidyltransferase